MNDRLTIRRKTRPGRYENLFDKEMKKPDELQDRWAVYFSFFLEKSQIRKTSPKRAAEPYT